MALFRSFRMTEEQLKTVPIQDGYFYLTDQGCVYIDWDHTRYSINSKYAQGLISEDGKTIIKVDDIYKLIQNSNNSGTKEYQITIAPSDWVDNQYTWKNEELTCGPAGITPPRISCISNRKEYLYIIDADATPNTGITFSAYKTPTQNIQLLIVDTVGESNGDSIPSDPSIPNLGRIEETMDGITVTRIDIPRGYTTGGYVSLDDTIENKLREIT